jgi:LmbE family N-acetylglucosaminyl deacetylase
MKTLYIFPHPDDESFGPAPVIYRQIQQGEKVHLLTLTRGGATKVRFKYGYSIQEMGEVRLQEMQNVKSILGLTSMTVLDYEDGGMAQMNPLDWEEILMKYIDKIKPNIIVTYPIHGISGHPDHIAIHGIMKRLFCALKLDSNYDFLKRLAFLTLPTPEGLEKKGAHAKVRSTKREDINCEVTLSSGEQEKLKESLFCYETFLDVIQETGVIQAIGNKVYFEFFNEEVKVEFLSEALPK